MSSRDRILAAIRGARPGPLPPADVIAAEAAALLEAPGTIRPQPAAPTLAAEFERKASALGTTFDHVSAVIWMRRTCGRRSRCSRSRNLPRSIGQISPRMATSRPTRRPRWAWPSGASPKAGRWSSIPGRTRRSCCPFCRCTTSSCWRNAPCCLISRIMRRAWRGRRSPAMPSSSPAPAAPRISKEVMSGAPMVPVSCMSSWSGSEPGMWCRSHTDRAAGGPLPLCHRPQSRQADMTGKARAPRGRRVTAQGHAVPLRQEAAFRHSLVWSGATSRPVQMQRREPGNGRFPGPLTITRPAFSMGSGRVSWLRALPMTGDLYPCAQNQPGPDKRRAIRDLRLLLGRGDRLGGSDRGTLLSGMSAGKGGVLPFQSSCRAEMTSPCPAAGEEGTRNRGRIVTVPPRPSTRQDCGRSFPIGFMSPTG